MQWRVTLEAIDPTGDKFRREFEFDKDLDGLVDGNVGCSIEHGKTIMREIQKTVVEHEINLWVQYRRVCPDCGGKLPIKDYQRRKIQTVFGAVPIKYPRLVVCQQCRPGLFFTLSPVTEICPDRATAELLEVSAELGARMSYREAANILEKFLPDQNARRFTTLRHRTLNIGKRIEAAEQDRLWYEHLERQDRDQKELRMDGDLKREFVFNVETAHIPLAKRYGGRTFEAVVGHCGRGGRGSSLGPVFAFEGTCVEELKATAHLALLDQCYEGRGELTVISDGEECLKRLSKMLPQPTNHILDWFHIAMKVQALAQLARTAPDKFLEFEVDIDRIKWRLWHGQTARALGLISSIKEQLTGAEADTLWSCRAIKNLETLETYIARNRGSVVNYANRYRSGQRIATSPAEASVNALVAKRFVKKATNAVVTDRGSLSSQSQSCGNQWKHVGTVQIRTASRRNLTCYSPVYSPSTAVIESRMTPDN